MNGNAESRARTLIVSLAMLLAGSLLVGFSMGRWLAPLAAWIGPVLIMRYARDNRVWRGYLLVLVACILAVFIAFISIWLGGLPKAMVPFLVVGIGLLWSLPYLADRLVSPRLPGFSSTLVFPLAATTLEFLFIHFNPLGTWGAWGFTQYGNLPLMQLASVTGMIGITFLMAWAASVANWAWENRGRGREVLPGLVAFGGVFAAVFIFGFLRLNLAPTSQTDETVRVAGITAQSLQTLFASEPDPSSQEFDERLQSYWDTYFEASAREARAGARVIVWPELAGMTLSTDEASYIAQAKEVARQNEAYLAISLNVLDPNTLQRLENKLVVIDPSGVTVIEHLKYGGAIIEPGRTGDGILQTVSTPFGMLSGVICWDADFPTVVQQAGRNGTGLMLVPSSDWYQIDPVHSHMAVFRAIENGMSLVRQTHGGLSIAVDPYGRVLAQTDFFGASDRTMVAQVPVRHVTTIYTLFGRWLEWLAPIGFLFLVAWVFIARRQVK
ncbi:MAG TPA: nitrilase-related carbon-nitrogen hydrolase [Anaerolineae bacterium]|nr:nitrilase-related carbon-nitrogen hydrolase [Anaerolineae bacterium]